MSTELKSKLGKKVGSRKQHHTPRLLKAMGNLSKYFALRVIKFAYFKRYQWLLIQIKNERAKLGGGKLGTFVLLTTERPLRKPYCSK
jgi:hypothetical protein